MLIQFSVENFMSFKTKAILSLVPSTDKEHPENINVIDSYKATNLLAIYGANASGKSSLFMAMTCALNLIRISNYRQVNQPYLFETFKFDEKTKKSPAKFEFIFVAEDNNRYVYGFSADKNNIYEEYLYLYKSQRPSLIFERTEGNKYTYKSQKKTLEPLERFNAPNKLFLATATNWNTECTRIPFRWLTEGILTFTDAQQLQGRAIEAYKSEKKEAYIKFTEKLLAHADINISKLDFNIRKVKLEKSAETLTPQLVLGGQIIQQALPEFQEIIEVTTEHQIGKGNKKHIYKLGINEESLGTNQLFLFGPFLKDAFDKGKTIVIDEIDKSLHPIIVKAIINMFRDSSINTGGAQLIFTTHDTSLLTLSIFRRDQIYFTEKNSETGESDLYALDEFSVRKSDNIERDYLLGRYGAIPFVRGEEL